MRSRHARRNVLLRLIDQVYAAAGTPSLWEVFLRSLSALEAGDRRILSSLAPHVCQALRIHHRLVAAQHAHAVAVDALDAAPCAVFLVTAGARVLLANRRGLAMLSHGDAVSTDQGRLSALCPRDTTRLRELCAAGAISRADSSRRLEGAMTLGRSAPERPPLQVVVAPGPPLESRDMQGDRVTAMVFISDPAEERAPSEALVREAYGLTPAEAHVATRIAAGYTPAEIAAERGTALETVRRQIKQVLAKTGARHRAALVRLLSALPANRF